jgi:O-antigen/teichoic acid export membrane protein
MVSEQTQTTMPVSEAEHRASFFRQSGWIMIANIAAGAMMWAVHFLAKQLKEGEYGTFVAMLSVVMCVPVMPLQMVLAQQAAKGLATGKRAELSGIIRTIWFGTFIVWLLAVLAVLLTHGWVMDRWHIKNPVVLWITLVACLFSAWLPMFLGALQGKQNFLWMGWGMILSGVGRLAVAAVAVFAIGGYATGMMSGVAVGALVGSAVGLWFTRDLWQLKPARFDWQHLLAQVVPLMLGFAAFQFLFTADTMFVKAYFAGEVTDAYGAAGTLSRALMWLVGPLASVMFPRIVHSAARSEKSDLMRVVLLGTLVMAAGGAIGLWLLGPFVVKIIYPARYAMETVALLPWYAWAMVPLALANVLLNNLLARGSFRVVPALIMLALAYAFALTRPSLHASPVTVLQVLGVCNLLLLGVSSWFTWRDPSSTAKPAAD